MIAFGVASAGEVYQKPDESVAPNVYQVTAVLDLNGDGKLEVIVHSFYYEGGQTTIYRCEPDKIEAGALGRVRSLRDRGKFAGPNHAHSFIKKPWNCSVRLKKHFGYDQFRPLQGEIIEDALAGRDVFVLMPTGGGKSLCFQLPALMRDGLTIVVSPLIALMKDQVDALQTSGIPATYLNSTLDREEAKARWRGLHRGEYRMLYVAPERLMLDTFFERALNWNIAQFAIDEAHCISEWGHDFRPEYRELKKLRKHLPDVPIMALTATATERVRADIIKELKLRDPRAYVASFNRPNLTYRVVPKTAPYEQLLAFIRSRPNDSGIVYCASRKSTESLARNLNEDGVSAKPYHAGLTNAERTKHQDAFLRDDVRVITATIAFGMGINKPNVRFVVHYDLPKNLESYYQETGRAGRDGLPSECVLLFSAGDVAKQLHFIDEKSEKRSAYRPCATSADGPLRRDARMPARDASGIFWRNNQSADSRKFV